MDSISKNITDKVIEDTYKMISKYFTKYLKEKKVKLPNLRKKERYTKDGLVLVRLALNYPNTEVISKEELTKFVKKYYPDVVDVQQARHLGLQKGWYIITGTRGDLSQEKIPSGTYKLVSLKEPHPAYISQRRTGIKENDFEKLKKMYGYKCACCGSKEGEAHNFRKNINVYLQEGHMDPSKDLIAGNIIPQCQICNRPDRNRWIYDATGRVIKVANTPDGYRIVLRYLENADLETLLNIKKEIENYIIKKKIK